MLQVTSGPGSSGLEFTHVQTELLHLGVDMANCSLYGGCIWFPYYVSHHCTVRVSGGLTVWLVMYGSAESCLVCISCSH
jgi:hypothetical protein